MKKRPFGSIAVAASAAALPMAGTATAADLPVKALNRVSAAWAPQWQFSAEGGMLISKYSRSAFPVGLDPGFADKLGALDSIDRSGSLAPGRNVGWYGALSIGRDIDPVWDWRLSGAFNTFGTNRRSAAVNQEGSPDIFEFANSSRLVTESDRFRFSTVDFDLGRKWRDGLLQMRAFTGLRAMGTDQRFDISDSEAKGLTAFDGILFTAQGNRVSETSGRSRFFGVGPRVGVEGFYGTTIGIVGSASAAFLGGWRYSTFDQTQTGSSSANFCFGPEDCIGPFTSNNASANSVHQSKFAGVGHLAASLGVAWRPAPGTSIEVGYRVEYLMNVRESFAFANSTALPGHGTFEQKKDVLINVPYVKGVIRF